MSMSDVIRGCLWAAAVMAPAALAGLAVIYYAASRRDAMSAAALFAGAIRLLLSVAGSVTILCFVAVPVVWFVAWLGLFYFVMLVAEVYFAISRANREKEQRLVTT
jgi:hypothetical protein